jgi:hypothetical protein
LKVRFKGRELELWEGARGGDLLSPDEQTQVTQGNLALWEEHDCWMGIDGALRSGGKYSLLDARQARLRMLPSIDRVLAHPALAEFARHRILTVTREILVELRLKILSGEKIVPQLEAIIRTARSLLKGRVDNAGQASLPAWTNPSVIVLTDPFQSLAEALHNLAPKGTLALSRQHLAECAGQKVGDKIKEAGWNVLLLGTVNRCKISDFQKAVETGINAMAFLTPDSYTIEGFVANVKPELLAGLALSTNIPLLYYP